MNECKKKIRFLGHLYSQLNTGINGLKKANKNVPPPLRCYFTWFTVLKSKYYFFDIVV